MTIILICVANNLFLIAKNCKLTAMGTEYRGTQNTTASGLTCQAWSSQSPQPHNYNRPEDSPDKDLRNNYCRNPDLEPSGPWCYTTSTKRWEYCDIKMCDSGRLSLRHAWTCEYGLWCDSHTLCTAHLMHRTLVQLTQRHDTRGEASDQILCLAHVCLAWL